MNKVIDFLSDWRFLSVMCAANLVFAMVGHRFNAIVAVLAALCVGHHFGERQ